MSWRRNGVGVPIPLPNNKVLTLGASYDLCRWALGIYTYWARPYAWGTIYLGPFDLTWDVDRDWRHWVDEEESE